jgi:hypothetical protein
MRCDLSLAPLRGLVRATSRYHRGVTCVTRLQLLLGWFEGVAGSEGRTLGADRKRHIIWRCVILLQARSDVHLGCVRQGVTRRRDPNSAQARERECR